MIPSIEAMLQAYPNIAYPVITVGILCSAVFPLCIFWYGEFVFIPASILIGLGTLSFWGVLASSVVGAFLGDMINYYLGYHYGRRLFRPGNRYLNERVLEKWERYFQKYGLWGVIPAKFIPLIPWTVSFLAWVHRMNIFLYIVLDIIAGIFIFGAIYWLLSGGTQIIGNWLGHLTGQ